MVIIDVIHRQKNSNFKINDFFTYINQIMFQLYIIINF